MGKEGGKAMADQTLISMERLHEHLHDEHVVVIDCRFELTDESAGRRQYEESHIPGAVYFDLEKDLSGPKEAHGGRHPLPDVDEFAEKLGKAGVDETTNVVAYDDQNGSMAARLWWMLRYLGHDRVSVLDVPFSTWEKEDYPTSNEWPRPKRRTFVPHIRADMAADMKDVRRAVDRGDVVLIDARAPERYRGEQEPMDPKAGHIPGAKNRFWKDNVAATGKWKSADELKERFRDLKDRDVIVYCGSGVTATANALALKAAGKDVKVYTGSWSDWSSYPDNPVATGDEE